MRGLAILAVLGALAGCGGNSRGRGYAGKLVGTYTGTFIVTRRGTLPPDFNPPETGMATATVTRSGTLSIDFGSSYVVGAKVRADGLVDSGSVTYTSTDGPRTLPALVSWGMEDGQRRASAHVEFTDPFGRANFSVFLTRAESS
ncbi:hypothetical protein EON82_09345 [bacterium]|nr:MAG: hypothetical protein EON82_09345 [bacterium]